MATLDIFNNNAFKLISMLKALDSVDFRPQRLGDMNVFTPNPVRNQTVAIESRGGILSLIKTSQRGSPLEQQSLGKRVIRDFRTLRVAQSDRILASELADVRAFGTESELQQVQTEIARRLVGPVGLSSKIEMTLENMRLGAIHGVVKDADGATLYDWYSEFGVTQAAEINFDLRNATPLPGAVRKLCNQVVRAMMKESKGTWTPSTIVYGLCGDAFWDDLTAHKEVRETYLNTQAAADLRNGNAYGAFNYGGITFENYRGTDDGATVAVGDDKVRFFPVNAPGAFLEVFSPGEQFGHLGQLGQRLYPMIVPDRDRDMFADIEVYCYPLHICTRPKMLQRGKRA